MADKNEVQKYVAEATEVVAKLVQAMAREAIAELGVTKAEDSAAARPVEKKSRKGGVEALPCPVTGVLNKHRRFSYLMPEARTPANLKKYRGWAKKNRVSA